MTLEPVDAQAGENADDTAGSGHPASAAPDDVARPADSSAERAAQSELDLGVVSTGSAVVDNALRALESLGERSVADHAEAYEQVLDDLTDAMNDPASAHVHDPDRSTPTG